MANEYDVGLSNASAKDAIQAANKQLNNVALVADKVLVSTGGKVTTSDRTVSELNTLAGVTGNVEARLDAVEAFTQNPVYAGELKAGSAKIGGTSDNTEIKTNGNIKFNGTASTWEDANFDPTMLTGNGNRPVSTQFASTGIYIAGFAGGTTDDVTICIEYPHNAKLNVVGESSVKLSFHCHCYTTDATGGNVRLGIEYLMTKEDLALVTPTTTYLTGSLPTVAWQRKTFTFTDITAPDCLGVQLFFRFYRLGGDPLDTATQTIAISTIGFHYEIDAIGSETINSKTGE